MMIMSLVPTLFLLNKIRHSYLIRIPFILVVINEQGESNNGDYENNEVVQEIFHTDLNLELSNGKL